MGYALYVSLTFVDFLDAYEKQNPKDTTRDFIVKNKQDQMKYKDLRN